jgi:hypothetical protein
MKMKLLNQLQVQPNAPQKKPEREPNWGFAAVATGVGLLAIGALISMDDKQPINRPDTEVTNEVPSAVPSESVIPTPEPSPTDIPTFED